ncbi:MAG TPA: glycosyltransferase [Methanobacterium sp.]|nr:glycosyltransferase [Methanobacterium sp.]
MKILILVESLKVGGGSERFAATLGTQLHSHGYEVSYLTLMDETPKYDFKGDYYTLNIDDIYANYLKTGFYFKRGFNLFRYSPEIKRICEDLKVDTIISVSEIANFYAILSRWLFRNDVPIISTQHMNPEIFMDSPLKYRLIKFFYHRTDEVVCVSREIERILNQDYDVKNTKTIYNMMDIEENIKLSLEALPQEFQALFTKDCFNFINIGRLNQQKGQWFLIRSFRQVVDKYDNARLFILGEGDLRGKLEDLIHDLDLGGNVFLLGEQENVFPFLKNSDCFIFSSLWEGLPLTLIEALSMDLPIISTDCKTGPREVLCPELDLDKNIDYPYLGKHAILTKTFPNKLLIKNLEEIPLNKTESQMSDMMIKMIEDSNLRKNYSNGRKRSETFSNKKIIKKWDDLINNL